jgi:hypothetical protein
MHSEPNTPLIKEDLEALDQKHKEFIERVLNSGATKDDVASINRPIDRRELFGMLLERLLFGLQRHQDRPARIHTAR